MLSYGSAGLFVVTGVVSGVLVGGLAGELSALVLISVGFVGAVLLVFYEIGLSEDRERAADAERPPEDEPPHSRWRLRPRGQHRSRWPRRPS